MTRGLQHRESRKPLRLLSKIVDETMPANPYEHELNGVGATCSESCPACLWAKRFEATGDARKDSLPVRQEPDAKELNAKFERRFSTPKE